jgi:hypothetical protein
VRNRFWEAISRSSKVAAVLGGDDHVYHRLLVDSKTPVGLYPDDDTNGDGVLDQCSPNPRFKHATWQLIAGTAGAPFYGQEKAPWKPEKFSPQQGYLLFEASGDRISVTCTSILGQKIDHVENLMDVKK